MKATKGRLRFCFQNLFVKTIFDLIEIVFCDRKEIGTII